MINFFKIMRSQTIIVKSIFIISVWLLPILYLYFRYIIIYCKNNNFYTENMINTNFILINIMIILLIILAIYLFYLFAKKLTYNIIIIDFKINELKKDILLKIEKIETKTTHNETFHAYFDNIIKNIEDFSSYVLHTIDVIKNTHELILNSEEQIQTIFKTLNEFIKSLSEMLSNSEELSQIIYDLKNIDFNTQILNDIVNNTNLLSLNASIEAARASDYGKGFAIVADEIGFLSKKSGNAVSNISEQIQISKTKITNLVKEIEKTTFEGKIISKQTVDYFEKILIKSQSVIYLINRDYNYLNNEQKKH